MLRHPINDTAQFTWREPPEGHTPDKFGSAHRYYHRSGWPCREKPVGIETLKIYLRIDGVASNLVYHFML